MSEQLKKLNELNRCFKECFLSKSGKKVLKYLEDTYHISETTMRGATDKGMIEGVIFSEGQRTVVLDIKDRLEQKEEDVNG